MGSAIIDTPPHSVTSAYSPSQAEVEQLGLQNVEDGDQVFSTDLAILKELAHQAQAREQLVCFEPKAIRALGELKSKLEGLLAYDDLDLSLANASAPREITGLRYYLKQLLLACQTDDANPNNLRQDFGNSITTSENLLSSFEQQCLIAQDLNDCRISLGAMCDEVKQLNALVYMIEERRHLAVPEVNVEVDVLVSILDEAPEGENTGTPNKRMLDDRLSIWNRTHTDSIASLASKLSPLIASVQMFRPRLEICISHTQKTFPTVLNSVTTRFDQLVSSAETLLKDFQKVKKELNEDKWLVVFRQVSKQASDMMESLQRTLKAIKTTSFASETAVRVVESFEMKSEHYSKAIPAVLTIVQRGVKDRLTLNGEVIRGSDLLVQRWTKMKLDIESARTKIDSARKEGQLSQFNKQAKASQKPSKAAVPAFVARQLSKLSLIAPSPRTPKKTRLADHTAEAIRSQTKSALGFRKDISLETPRSHSRLSMTTPDRADNRPRWNGGTVARVLDQPLVSLGSPGRSPSRQSTRPASRLGTQTSLSLSRPTTPSLNTSRTSLPFKTPSKTANKGISRPQTPSANTTAIRTSYARLPPITPSKAGNRSTSGIPVINKRFVSESLVMASPGTSRPPSTPSRPSTAGELFTRRTSGIPQPSPRK